MSDAMLALRDTSAFDRPRLARGIPPHVVSAALALGAGVLAGVVMYCAHPAATPTEHKARIAPAKPIAPVIAPRDYSGLLDPSAVLGSPVSLALSIPLQPHFAPPAPLATVGAPPQAAAIDPSPSQGAPMAPAPPSVSVAEIAPEALPVIPPVAESIPLPAPRPPELRAPVNPLPMRRFAQRGRPVASVVDPPADNRGFFEKLFGIRPPAGPALAYAAPEDGIFGGPRRLTGGSVAGTAGTAVYNIAAHTVTLPDGTRLEAHSGLGALLDDPRHVNERMRGATPPAVYDLQLREQLFHGVQALRLNPIGGGTVYGRTGLLAHTFMLGPNGDSNGCVSFRDYNAFLRAYMNGEVKRLVVVAGGV